MLRICSISHNDLDGIASAIAVQAAFPNDHVKTVFVSHESVHEELRRACEEILPWDKIIMSDISIKAPSEKQNYSSESQKRLVYDMPNMLKSFVDNGGDFIVIDHHEKALDMKDFYGNLIHPDSIIEVKDFYGRINSGSELAARFMMRKISEKDCGTEVDLEDDRGQEYEEDEDEGEDGVIIYDNFDLCSKINDFCKIAGDLDVWRNPFGFGGKIGLALELMDDAYGAYSRISNMIHMCTAFRIDIFSIFEEGENATVSQLADDVLLYYYNMAKHKLSGAMKNTEKNKIEHHRFLHQIDGRFFPNHCAMNIYQKTNGAIVITYPNNPKRISIRKHPELNIHLGFFCSRFGGGGHENAAGLTLPRGVSLEDLIESLVEEISENN